MGRVICCVYSVGLVNKQSVNRSIGQSVKIDGSIVRTNHLTSHQLITPTHIQQQAGSPAVRRHASRQAASASPVSAVKQASKQASKHGRIQEISFCHAFASLALVWPFALPWPLPQNTWSGMAWPGLVRPDFCNHLRAGGGREGGGGIYYLSFTIRHSLYVFIKSEIGRLRWLAHDAPKAGKKTTDGNNS